MTLNEKVYKNSHAATHNASFQPEFEQTELELLTKQLLKATDKNKELLSELSRSKGSVEKLNVFIKEQEKKLSDYGQLNYTSKKSQEQKWETEKLLESKTSEVSALESEMLSLKNTLEERKQQIDQLERVIQFLRERSEEINLEANQLKEDHHEALKAITDLRQQEGSQEERLTEMGTLLSRANIDAADARDELVFVHKQLENLKKAVVLAEARTQDQGSLIQENHELKNRLETQTAAWDQTQQEIHTIRQSLLKTLKDSKKLEIQYEEVLNERIALSNRAAQLQNRLDLQIDQTRICQEQLVEAQQKETRNKIETEQELQKLQEGHEKEVNELTRQLSEMESQFSAMCSKSHETEINLLEAREEAISHLTSDYEQSIAALNKELEQTRQQLHELQNASQEVLFSREELKSELQHLSHQLNTAESGYNEKENELRISQQHLAKKVKEVTILQDKIDLQQNRIEELSRSLAAAEQKTVDLEKALSDEHQRSSAFQFQMTDALKVSEQKAAKMEEKYLDLHHKWAATEAKNRELEKLADRHHQMQSQIHQFLGGFAPVPHQAKPHMVLESPQISFSDSFTEIDNEIKEGSKEDVKEKESSVPFHNLLQPMKGTSRIKSNLFD